MPNFISPATVTAGMTVLISQNLSIRSLFFGFTAHIFVSMNGPPPNPQNSGLNI